jgi:hypothetical protein
MEPPTPAWVPLLNAALVRGPEVVSATGNHVSTTYALAEGGRDRLVEGLAEIIVYLYGPTARAADNPSWRAGTAVGRKAWEKLLRQSGTGDHPEVKTGIGEAFAWWHESLTPGVVYAQRPFFGTSLPVIDSLSVIECGTEYAVRGVQAKVYADRARPAVDDALGKFARLQEGEFDPFWGDAVYRLEMEVRASGGPPFDPSLVSAGDQLLHFSVVVCHEAPATGDPAFDYHPRLTADPPHGRSATYLEHAPTDQLVGDVAAAIRRRALP